MAVAIIVCLPFVNAQEKPKGKPIPEGWAEQISLNRDSGCLCCFDGELPESGVLYARTPAKGELDAIVTNILKYAGLAPNFRVVEVDKNNAYATVSNGERILGFGSRYLQAISTRAGTDWARLGVMAHEVGHHVQGHTNSKVTQASSHQRELQADEYAGFIMGMMGASKKDSAAHTALMSAEGSESHPPRAKRIEVTQRGWLMAQHIRRTVKSNQVCPLFRFTGTGFEQRAYAGKIGESGVTISLSKSPDRTVFGTYDMKVKGKQQQYRFVGRANSSGDRITLEEYFGCEPSATIELTKSTIGTSEYWKGKMIEPDGKEFNVDVKRALTPIPITEPDEPKKTKTVTDHRKLNYVTTFSGVSQRWFCVISKGRPYTSQIVKHGDKYPLDWVRTSSAKGFRVIDVSGDANGWVVVMAKGTGLGDQKIIGPGPINETRYAALRDQGYRITSLAGYDDSWVWVLSKQSGLGKQRYTYVGKFNESWLNRRLGEGYRITQVAGDDSENGGSWMVVVSKGSSLGKQVYSNGSGFPAKWIKARWDEGYRITGASGCDNWRVIMSKNSGLNQQSYRPPSSEFPAAYIRDKFGKAHTASIEE